MNDSVEYRLAVIESFVKFLIAVVFLCTGVLVYGIGVVAGSFVLHSIGLGFVLLGVITEYRVIGESTDGWSRWLFGKINGGWKRPALDDWGEKLHDRGKHSYQTDRGEK